MVRRPDVAPENPPEPYGARSGQRLARSCRRYIRIAHSAALRSTRRDVLGFGLRQAGDTQENLGQLGRKSSPHIRLQQRMEFTGFQDEELQMQLGLSHTLLDRRHAPRAGARFAAAVVLVSAWSGIPAAVLAQSNPLPQTNMQGPMPAPIGHRQPRAQDLPPDVLRDEGMNRQPAGPASTMPPDASRDQPDASRDQGDRHAGRLPFGDDDLQICRQC
jgi:hypothetical protein